MSGYPDIDEEFDVLEAAHGPSIDAVIDKAPCVSEKESAVAASTSADYPSPRFDLEDEVGTESDFEQWATAMKMIVQLPGGIPADFRRRMWLTLANRHLKTHHIKWDLVQRTCLSEWSLPADSELGIQIVKDLHRTGCSLFCGEGGRENQILLKRVLLAYARWNKNVGYCQGFNMLAALLLQVTDRIESDALKLMICLIEGVLPEGYFAENLRGLSVDMAAFRELLRSRLPRLSRRLDLLQSAGQDNSISYEPPLTNVFTMQWFLTLFCNCLPQATVLRVWDLILLEGNEILLRTGLAIWQILEDRIAKARTADEFYCIMGVITHELLEDQLIDDNLLIRTIVSIGPLKELNQLRDHFLYDVMPLKATAPAINTNDTNKQLKVYRRERLALDMSVLKQQYDKLRQRQRQAHIIWNATINRSATSVCPSSPVNHLLISNRSALVPVKHLEPLRHATTLLWKDIPRARSPSSSTSSSYSSSSSSSSDTELCDDNETMLDDADCSPCDLLDDDKDASSRVSSFQSNVDNHINTNFSAHVPKTCIDSTILVPSTKDSSCDTPASSATMVTTEESKLNCARRNSERALQIIQENSAILHRIMQCQAKSIFGRNETKTQIDGQQTAYDSHRYTSILKRSEDLNERYNHLIENSSKPCTSKTVQPPSIDTSNILSITTQEQETNTITELVENNDMESDNISENTALAPYDNTSLVSFTKNFSSKNDNQEKCKAIDSLPETLVVVGRREETDDAESDISVLSADGCEDLLSMTYKLLELDDVNDEEKDENASIFDRKSDMSVIGTRFPWAYGDDSITILQSKSELSTDSKSDD